MMKRFLLCAALAGVASLAQAEDFRLNRLFGDHAVLQREKPVWVWGYGATPGGFVDAAVGEAVGCTRANADGSFRLVMEPQKAGGPFELVVTDAASGRKVSSADVWIGEVWLGSGQSNMDFRLRLAIPEPEPGDRPDVRMFTVPEQLGYGKMREAPADWELATEANRGGFSAAGYFFAQELAKRLGCYVGFIHSSVGGSAIEPWMPREALLADPKSAGLVSYYRDCMLDRKAWEFAKEHNYFGPQDLAPLDEGVDPRTEPWKTAAIDPADTNWIAATMPTSFQKLYGRGLNGAVWFRTDVELPAAFRGKELELHLGALDKMDRTYVNGTLVGETGKGRETCWWNVRRVYPVPAALTGSGRMALAVRVWSQIFGGQMAGPASQMYLAVKGDPAKRLPVVDGWRARLEREVRQPVFEGAHRRKLPGVAGVPHALYDGMIEPVVGYTLRGMVWYQGEANSGLKDKRRYGELVGGLVRSWRLNWGQGDFPFIQVELAAYYDEAECQPKCGWSNVRYGQLEATRTVPNVGLVSAIDVGDAFDIHPTDKRTVGLRLAGWALANVYRRGKKDPLVCAPRFLSWRRDGNAIRAKYTDVGKGLVVKGGGDVCPCVVFDAKGDWHTAVGRVEGDELVISSPNVAEPTGAAYAWAANPKGLNLYGADGQPASPFLTDEQSRETVK